MKRSNYLLVLCAVLLFSISACASHANKAATKHPEMAVTKAVANSTTTKVNINKADRKTLMSVNGIGPRRSAGIISYREKHGAFKNIYDLTKVKGEGYSFSKKFVKSIAHKINV